MQVDFHFYPPQKSRFFAISPPKVDSKKSVKYISGPALTIKKSMQPLDERWHRHLFISIISVLSQLKLRQGAFS